MLNDKQKHVRVAAVIGLATLPVAFIHNIGFWWALLIMLIIGTIAFVGKEIVDKYKPNPTGFDRMDLVADFAGFACGAIVAFMGYFGWLIYLIF